MLIPELAPVNINVNTINPIRPYAIGVSPHLAALRVDDPRETTRNNQALARLAAAT